jgi:hypothetical protein
MTHLAPDELIDALDGALSPSRRGHLDSCAHCRGELASLHALMSEVRTTEVPEPSPLFWDRLSARVRSSLEEPDAPAVRQWLRWPVLAPLAGLAMLVAALVASVQLTRAPVASTAVDQTSNSADDVDMVAAADLESQWALLAELVGDLDYDAATAEGIVPPVGAADAAILQLSVVEQAELARLLREELKAGG